MSQLLKVVSINTDGSNKIGIIDEETMSGYNVKIMNEDGGLESPYKNIVFSKHSEKLNQSIVESSNNIMKKSEEFLDDLDNSGFFDDIINSSFFGEPFHVEIVLKKSIIKAHNDGVFLTDLDSFNFEAYFELLVKTKSKY
jgi:hypothetical protein